MPFKVILAAALAALAGAGCSVWGEASTMTLRSENGQVQTDSWNGEARCGIEPGSRTPCSTRSVRERTP
jgi:hypothetical protein